MVPASRCHGPAVGAERQVPDAVIVAENLAAGLSAGNVPEPGGVVGSGGRHGLAVGAEGSDPDLAVLPEHVNQSPGGDIPEPGRVIDARGQRGRAV